MTNKFKAVLLATSVAGTIIATGAAFDVDGFGVEIVQNKAVSETVSGPDANANAGEAPIVIARMLGRSDGAGGDGHGDGGEGRGGEGESGGRGGEGEGEGGGEE